MPIYNPKRAGMQRSLVFGVTSMAGVFFIFKVFFIYLLVILERYKVYLEDEEDLSREV